MLKSLIEKGTQNGYFEFSRICDLPKSQCKNAKTEVIDFDKTKELVMKQINLKDSINQFKSCDCLKIIPNLNRIDFIEIKGLNEYLTRYNDKSLSPEEQVKKFDIHTKYYDSNIILGHLLQKMILDLTNPVVKRIKEIRPNFILLIDIPVEKKSIGRFAVTLNTLSKFKDAKSEIIDCLDAEMSKVEYEYFSKKLIDESCVDNFYSNLIENS